MIDWVSFNLPWDGPPVGLQYFKRETWDAPIEPAFNKALMVEGSWSSAMAVQAIGGRLYVSGNPVKWLTGQNVCGTNDLQRLVTMTYDRLLGILGLPDGMRTRLDLMAGETKLTRVDCTFSYRVGTDEEVVTWLAAMELACHVRFRGRGHFDQGMCSLMFGLTSPKEGTKAKGSRRSSFKFYNKLREMSVHEPKCSGDMAKRIKSIVTGAVRGEACYRGIELKRFGLDVVKAWDQGTAYKLHREWVDRMEMAETYTLKSEIERDLPKRLQVAYHLWRSGVDVREMMGRTQFYIRRKELLAHGIDISAPRQGQDAVNVIPILRVLEAKPMDEEETEMMFWNMARAA